MVADPATDVVILQLTCEGSRRPSAGWRVQPRSPVRLAPAVGGPQRVSVPNTCPGSVVLKGMSQRDAS